MSFCLLSVKTERGWMMERAIRTHDKLRGITGMGHVQPNYMDHDPHVTAGEMPNEEYVKKLRQYHGMN